MQSILPAAMQSIFTGSTSLPERLHCWRFYLLCTITGTCQTNKGWQKWTNRVSWVLSGAWHVPNGAFCNVTFTWYHVTMLLGWIGVKHPKECHAPDNTHDTLFVHFWHPLFSLWRTRTRHRENKGCHATPERVLLRVLLRIFNSGVEIRMWGKIEYILDNLMLGYK